MVLTTFLLFLSLFFIIGVASLFASKGTTRDYLMASKSVSPGLVGLSAVATNNSGFMFIGMIGATYTMGLSSIWIMLGWIAGDWLAQSYTVTKIRAYAQPNSVSSYGGLITQWM
ncbi:MAG: sodium/proline symporter, partial [Thiomicrorhabdus sp.]|nr:sodium/proline symporter [Thiomicrorhabdus sp.]